MLHKWKLLTALWTDYRTPSSPRSEPTKIRKEITEWTAYLVLLEPTAPNESTSRDLSAVSSPVAWGNKQAWGARKRWRRSRQVILAPGSASASPQARKGGLEEQVLTNSRTCLQVSHWAKFSGIIEINAPYGKKEGVGCAFWRNPSSSASSKTGTKHSSLQLFPRRSTLLSLSRTTLNNSTIFTMMPHPCPAHVPLNTTLTVCH